MKVIFLQMYNIKREICVVAMMALKYNASGGVHEQPSL